MGADEGAGRASEVGQEISETNQSSIGEELFSCFQTLLNQIEEAEGSVDLELREKLDELYTETTRIPAEQASAEMSNTMIQTQLDDLSERMKTLESKISDLAQDPEVGNLLGATSDLWFPVVTASADERRRNASPSPP